VSDLLKLEQQKKPYNPTEREKDDYDIYAGSEDWDDEDEKDDSDGEPDETFEDDDDRR
jgi:hypothetical protein